MKTLDNMYIAVTRPTHQAASICAIIEQEGGHVIRWPLLAIQSITLSADSTSALSRFDTFDAVIFISANAVQFGLAELEKHAPEYQQSLTHQQHYAVGKATARKAAQLGLRDVITPEQADSEGLLALPALQTATVNKQRILIIRGEGGRETLAETLRDRGAQVCYAEVYARETLKRDPAPLLECWHAKKLNIIMVTSLAGLDNLTEQLRRHHAMALNACPLLVVSERIAEQAREYGFQTVLTAQSANDNDVLHAAQVWHQTRNLS